MTYIYLVHFPYSGVIRTWTCGNNNTVEVYRFILARELECSMDQGHSPQQEELDSLTDAQTVQELKVHALKYLNEGWFTVTPLEDVRELTDEDLS